MHSAKLCPYVICSEMKKMPKRTHRAEGKKDTVRELAATPAGGGRGSRRSAPISIDMLRTLLAFHEQGGVSAAARWLKVSQPVVSRKLDSLTRAQTCGAILLRRALDDVPLAELADAYGVTEKAIRNRLSRARIFLRQRMKREEG